MQVPLGWLNEFIPNTLDLETLRTTLTSIGLEAEPYEPEPLDFAGVFIGRMANREPVREGRGFVYSVEIGDAFEGGKVDVYSTIPDLEVGKKYPVALPGGYVGDLQIEERDYKTFVSRGKFCASTELGLTKLEFVEHEDGTVEWADGLEDPEGRALSIFPDCERLDVGTDLAKWLLEDKAVTIELTSNRADCHCMLGVAREMQVVTGAEYRLPWMIEDFEITDGKTDEITIRLEDPVGCPLYSGLVFSDIRMAPSPLWMAKKLWSVGMRPISNVVDITNLVLYEFGQPLHAFDYALLHDATIIVRRAREGETMATIDGIVRNLTPADLVIADSKEPVAIAGVMGGYASEVTGKTEKVLLESAWFDPVSIRRTSRRLALRTESAIRFERGVDPEGVVRAAYRVAYLMDELKCGKPSHQIAVAREGKEEPIVVRLHESQIAKVLGQEVPTGETETILQGLGFLVDGIAPQWKIIVPSFRRDVFIAEDIIEEVARHIGYDNFGEALPRPHMRTGLVEDDFRLRLEMKKHLAGLGLFELNSFPLCSERAVSRGNPLLGKDASPAKILNPISEDASNLRIGLVQGVVETFIRNLKRGAPIYDVFEIGSVYWQDADDFHERRQIVIGTLGDRPGKKSERTREKGFLRLKGYIESMLEISGVTKYDIIADEESPRGILRYRIHSEGENLGIVEITTEEMLGGETFDRPVFTASFEWDLIRQAYVVAGDTKEFVKPPPFPAAERDLAFVIDESVAYGRMHDAIRESAGDLLEKVELFDVYRGKQVGEGKKNLAVNLIFRHPERTLRDEEVDEWIDKIIASVRNSTGGKLRDW
jgi:phenylalanyl-tRNA synthetase beta chain